VLPDVVEAMSCDDIVTSIFQNSNNVSVDSYYSSVSPMCTDTVDTHTDYYSTEMRECTPVNNDTLPDECNMQ